MLAGFDVRFEFIDPSGGAAVSTLNVGQDYTLKAFVQDDRADQGSDIPSGIFRAFFDVAYDEALVDFANTFVRGDSFREQFPGTPAGTVESGLLDDVGGLSRSRPAAQSVDASAERLLFSVPLTPTVAGTLDLDVLPAGTANTFSQFYSPLATVNDFDVSGDVINIVGAGVVLSGINGLQVTEGASPASFTAALNRAPSSEVTFTIMPQTSGLVSLSATTLTFTPNNWNVPQTVQITAVDDNIANESTAVTLTTSALQSSDSAFNGNDVEDIHVDVIDDDFASVLITTTSGLVTNENGQTATTQVRLTSQPTAPVTIHFTSNNSDEGTVSPSQLVFNNTNWNSPKTLTLTGVSDDVIDGSQNYKITGTISSSDPVYQSDVTVPTISAVNQNTTTAGLIIQPSAGLITREDGTSDSFNVRLASKPDSNVILNLVSSNPSEGNVNRFQLTFTPANWKQTQSVMVTGVNDNPVDGPVNYQINITPDPTSDVNYRSLAARSVSATNEDDDTPGLVVSQATRDFTTEDSGTTTFTVRLTTEPSGTVTVDAASSNTAEGAVSPGSIVFNSDNWDDARTITVTGDDDSIVDGDVGYNVTLTSSSTTDPGYNTLGTVTRSFTNRDNDLPGVVLEDTTGLQVDEQGGTDTFTARLQAQPVGNVTIQLASDNPNEVIVSPTSISFTPQNWNSPKTITITGVDDGVVDGPKVTNITFDLSSSADAFYSDFTLAPVEVTNVGDSARLIVSPIAGLVTKEANGIDSTDSFGVRLSRQPETDVIVQIVSSNPDEGVPTESQIVFTKTNFDQVQEVIIAGVDDDVADGDQSYTVSVKPTTASDVAYRDLPATTVSLTNIDDDIPSLITSAPTPDFTTEDGGTSTFTVRLNTKPTGTVRVDVSSDDPTEASVSPAFFDFDVNNWDQDQTVTVTGVDDPATDGDVAYNVTLSSSSSSDTGYNSLPVVTRSFTNRDNDPAGVVLTGTEGLQVNEDGSTDRFTVKLQSQPLENVTIALASDLVSEVTVSPTRLNFTPDNWNQFQSVTLTGVDDGLVVDGDRTANISFDLTQSSDTAYRSVTLAPVSVTNVDNDVPGVSVVANDPLQVSEDGSTSATFTVALNTPPMNSVTIDAVSSDLTEGTVSPASLSFNSSNFDQAQTITITGVDDLLVDGDVLFDILLSAASADAAYDGIVIAPVPVTNLNDDEGGVTVDAEDDLTVSETGTTATFSIVLKTEPTEDVTIPLATLDATELAVDQTQLVFTPENWNEPQSVTVTGVADNTVDPDVGSGVRIGPSESSDPEFDGLVSTPVSITNTNVDTASIAVAATDVMEGDSDSEMVYTLRLSGAVESGLTLNYATAKPQSGAAATPGSDYTAKTGTLTFSGTDGETMSISIPIIGDDIVETHETIALRLSDLVLGASGGSVADITLPENDVLARILNDDTATLTLGSFAAQTLEGDAGTTQSLEVQVALSGAVQGGFSARYATSDGTATVADSDYEAAAGTLNFDAFSAETQTVSINILGDDEPEADEVFTIALSDLVAGDAVIRDAITIVESPLSLTIENDDAPQLIVRNVTTDPSEGDANEDRVFRFEVELSADVDDPDGFTIPISTSDGTATVAGGDYTAADAILSFNGTAGEKQFFEVSISGDSIVEADETFLVRLAEVAGLIETADLIIPNREVTATIENDDSASIALTASQTSVIEGDAGAVTSITFTATLTGDLQDALTVNYQTLDATATTADNDYTAASGSFSLGGSAGQSQTFTVDVLGDNRVELAETFSVGLSLSSDLPKSITDAIALPAQPSGITISADDRASLSLSGATSVTEGDNQADAGELSFIVTLSNPISSGFQLGYNSEDGTAIAGEDYEATSGTMDFTGFAGETKSVTVKAIGDNLVEANETFRFQLGVISGLPSGLAELIDISSSSVLGTILDDDSAVLSISGPSSINEPGGPGGSTPAMYTITLSAPVQGGLSVGYATADGTATAGTDYDAVADSVSFANSSNQTQTVTVDVRGDSTLEGDESFQVALSELMNVEAEIAESISFGNPSITTTIADDDSATVSFATTGSSVPETDGTHTVNLVLNTTGGAVLTDALEVDVIVRQSSTADASDFTLTNTRVVFPAGSTNGTTQAINLSLTDDGQIEPTETIVLGLQTPDAGPGESVSDGSHTVSITDDPSDAVLSGCVWADTNSNTQRESNELGIGGVIVRLSGVDNQGQSVQRQSVTDASGRYEFRALAGGTYTITQEQPSEFYDGVAIGGSITGSAESNATGGTSGDNMIEQITLPASGQGTGFGFTELGYRASAIPATSFQARRPSSPTTSPQAPPSIQLPSDSDDTTSSVLDSIFANW